MAPRLFWIDAPLTGRLAIMPRPLGGDRLDDEIGALRTAGVKAVLSLLERDEIAELELTQEAGACAAKSIAFHTYPIADRGLPEDAAAFSAALAPLAKFVAGGGRLAIHCRAGIGRRRWPPRRSSLTSASRVFRRWSCFRKPAA
jgi:hypothetical protein